MDEGKLLTFDEFRILLFACGLREVDGIYMPEKEFTEPEIIMALQHMAESGLITAEGDEFIVREDLRAILKVIRESENGFSWIVSETGPKYYCYVSKSGVVVSELFREKKDTLKLRWFSEENFYVWKERIEHDYRGD